MSRMCHNDSWKRNDYPRNQVVHRVAASEFGFNGHAQEELQGVVYEECHASE